MVSRITYIPFLFLTARFILILSLPIEGIRGYGDYWNFYHLAGLGTPYFDLWVEFPPIFPFLSYLLYQLVGGRQPAYEYSLAILMSLIQAGNIFLFIRIAFLLLDHESLLRRAFVYISLLVGLFYGWTYYDPLAVFLLLLGIYLFLTNRDYFSASAFAFGALIKWFPILGLIILWRRSSIKKALLLTLLVIGLIGLVYGILYMLSPEMTIASIQAQVGRGSWETVWALVDGNLNTGNLGSQIDHLDPSTLDLQHKNPSKIPSWLSIIPFGLIGIYVYFKSDSKDNRRLISLLGFTFGLFFLWSPGWSPQWVLYLLPFILLLLPEREAALFALVLALINLLEWPILLSRGFFNALYVLIPLRILIIIPLVVNFWNRVKKNH